MHSDRPKIMRKYVKVIEIEGAGEYTILPGQRVIDSKVTGEMVVLPRERENIQRVFPGYKTIIVLECTEFEVDRND